MPITTLPPLTWKTVDVKSSQDQMRLLWSRIVEGTGDPRLREHLATLMRTHSLPPRDPEGLARAVQTYNQTKIKYLREHPETYASPGRTLQWGVGDCDDLTILTCAALRGAKIPCRAVFVGWSPKGSVGPIHFKHVYPEAFIRDKWVALESVKKVPYGWDSAADKIKKGFRVRRASVGDPETGVTEAGKVGE